LSTKKIRSKDPFLERERAQYEHPLPSREYILQLLTGQGVPVAEEKLAKILEIQEDERDVFSRRLRAMERDGQIMRNRKHEVCVVDKLDLIKGTVQGHKDGFGFLVPDEGGEDLFLGPNQMQKVLHGDRVMARIIGEDRRDRPEGSIVEVLERVNTRIVGRLFNEHGALFAVAENKRISQDFLIPPGGDMGAQTGQVVMIEIIEQPSKHAKPVGKVVEILGNYTDPGMEIEIALRKHDLPHVFPPEAEKLAKKFSPKVLKKDLTGREDLRELPLVTIDGETARDFDDAVFCRPLEPLEKGWKILSKGGWKLYVAIADVSHYVQPKDALDREAFDRGNSVYFPRRVIPMLPEELSNGLCSLNPHVERLCMVCELDISGKGEVNKYRFYPAVMNSRMRFTYTTVAAMLADSKGKEAREHKDQLAHVQELHKLFKVLAKAREKRGAIDFETIETQMIFNDQGKIERIVPVHRNDAHRLIEECMLAANVCASDFLQSNAHPTLYRIHEGPTPEKLEGLREFLKEFGLPLGGGDDPHAKDYAKLLSKVKGRPDEQLLQTVMLRSLRQAVYSPDNVGHFGLAYESYAHFTSPIRRYPDLLVHRAIKAVLKGQKYQPGKWAELGVHCSQTERRADEATRDVDDWLKCFYMQDKVGEIFDGTVASVTGFGVFVALDNIYVEGLVHVTELGSDYFHFDAAKHELLGERTGQRFRLGDRLKVKVARADLETIKIDFVMAEPKESKRAGSAERRPAKAKEGGRRPALKEAEGGKKPSRKRKARG